MTEQEKHRFSLRRWIVIILVSWTAVSVFFLMYASSLIDQSVLAQVHTKALEAFNKDQAFRLWATMHGGVYVPVTDDTPSNPYLAASEKDISTPAGIHLTLMNPAYMVRQLNESFGSLYGMQGHITSLEPLRPENKADEWETGALRQFEEGTAEVYEIVQEGGEKYVRFMRPMITSEGCLKCHEHQGYVVGDVRGGVSVKVAMAPFLPAGESLKERTGLLLSLLWLAGVGMILFGADLLHRNLREREEMADSLRRAKGAAESANVSKSMFLANMSHEIRTPLNGIAGVLELFRRTPLSREQSEYVDAAMESGKRLNHLLSDILDLSMVEADVMKLRHEPVDLKTLLTETEMLFWPSARQAGLTLECCLASGTPQMIQSDGVRLQQLFSNLVGNAIKFSSNGNIVLTTTPLPVDEEGKCRILFTVSDNGRGIPEKGLAKMFEPFAQMEESYTKSYQGAGLGLAICKRIIDLMGGAMAVSSLEDEGTTVYLSIPFELAVVEEKAVKPRDMGDGLPDLGLDVLLVEDDRVSRMVAERLLVKMGCRVATAENGQEALDVLRDDLYDVVLMDIQMPVLNGIEATQAIRNGEAGEVNATIPIVAMTAYATASDGEKFIAAGMDRHVTKPVDIQRLLDVMNSYDGRAHDTQ
ncbi:ATP-binding protein [Pseudodesulfovibrio sp. zrk46]|uniref:ATP-binding protein n=1 Tax=Pseudodesulfovibrio sp. zrk46 TaxID=2725288 RepID=UPI001449BEC0|nr:ATP-binding protein [Pseudodesulfovibrio sp. zrk46]QJB55614.1 DUF3365 domain-containing protein [Pseudodesulfovibrio sp. zrk46]